MKTVEQAVAKLRRPPAVENWVRTMKRRTDDTAKSLVNFVLNPPRMTLRPVYRLITEHVTFDRSDADTIKDIEAISDARVRKLGYEIIPALLPHIKKNGWSGVQVYHDLVEFYPVGRGVSVPIRPTFVLNEDGKLVPYFVIGWADVPLDLYQYRILTTIITDSLLTLEEFQASDAKIVCVPRYKGSKNQRFVNEWNVSTYQPLDEDEKAQLFERYGNALDMATEILINELG